MRLGNDLALPEVCCLDRVLVCVSAHMVCVCVFVSY